MPCNRSLVGSPGPHPRGKLRGLARGGLQAHTQGGLQVHTQGEGGSPGPQLVGGGGSPGPHPGGVSQHALRQTPLLWTATAVGSSHPTGMHSC